MTQTDQNKADGKRSFWKTLPGILTAAAALLGAAASLITILNSGGLIDLDSNDPPSVIALSNQSEAELTEFRHPLAGAFADPEDEPLTYSATLANGDPLPDWLSIDPSSGELRGLGVGDGAEERGGGEGARRESGQGHGRSPGCEGEGGAGRKGMDRA